MSYENVPCASPDTEGQEEPAPSLYSVDEDKIRSVKKPMPTPSRLADIANIEDHVIMNEEEIAQVDRDSFGGRRDVYTENREVRTVAMMDKKDGETHEGIKHLDDRKSSGSYQRDRWIDLSLPTKRGHNYSKDIRSNNAEVPMNEFADRGTSVIKRTIQEISPDNENPNLKKINLHCNEKLTNDSSGVRMDRTDRTRAYYYHNSHEDFKTKPPVRDNRDEYDSDSERPSRELQKDQDQRAVPQIPLYYMQHPNSVVMSQAGKLGPQALGVLPAHAHLLRNRYGDNGSIHLGQRAEYANRPEQQVPVANSPGDSSEHNNTRYGGMPAHLKNAAGIHYVDRPGFVPQGFAVLPGIGPVRVVDGLYYAGIPTGHESTHYENFGAVSTFVPNVQGDVAIIHQQGRGAVTTPTGSTNADSSSSQEKPTNNKPYISQHINPSPPPSSIEETKQSDSPSIKSDRDSPGASTLDDTDKKSQIARQKGRPKPLPGSKPEIKCEQCGKIFGSSSALAKHKLTHSDERRYVCSICSKGFKRQDHLNGHMVTHRDKKPYECSYQDCDKSYCDMRSLRRHLENHHANGQGGNEGGSRTSSPALAGSDPSGNSSSTSVGESTSGRVVIKPHRGRPPKDRSLKSESHESTDNESGKNSGTSTPGSTHEVVVVRDQGTMVSSKERNSDSFSSTGSEDVVHVEKQTEVKQAVVGEEGKPHTAIDLLKQAAERAQEQRDKQNNMERFPQQHQYVMYPDGSISQYPQWYQTPVYAGQDPRFNVYQYPQLFAQQVYHHGPATQMIVNNPNMQRHQLGTRMYTDSNETPADKTKQQAVLPPKQVTQRSPSIEYPPPSSSAQGPFMRQQLAGTPTDPTAIALATAKENGQQLFTREGYYGLHPSGTQWQQVRYDESSSQYTNSENSLPTMGNVKTSFAHVRSPSNSSTSSEVDGDSEHYQRGIHYAPSMRHDGHENISRKPGHIVDGSYPKKDNSFHHVPEGNSPLDENKSIIDKEGKDDGIFRNPSEIVTPRRKQRPKPEPLKIPPSVSTAHYSNHPVPGSPPYTPPPMLSPRSIFGHVNAAGNLTPRAQLPMTPKLLLSSRSCRSSIDGEEEAVVFPEPKINVGPHFQAKIPDRVLPKEFAQNDVHRATLCWNLMDERKKGRTQEIEAFLEMSASCAIFGGSSNKEYALHILQRTKGNIKDAVKLILSKKHVTPTSDPMYNYHYEGSVKWSARERQTFRNAFRVKNKDFNDLQKEIGTKTVADCVEFYYLWKANNPEAVRGRTRYVDSDTEEEEEDDTGSETNSNPSLFECDFPQCSAKFVSRQALNGHIRVHGGSFMKPSEPRKRRNPTTTTNQDSDQVVVKRPRKPYVPAPMPQPLVEGGPLPEYACKVCGRIFHKIKSRSAHMKTHVKRPDDDHKHDMQH